MRHGSQLEWVGRDVSALFSMLTRYTRFVLLSKRALALVSLLLVVSLVAYPLTEHDRSGMRLSFVDRGQGGSNSSQPVMAQPEFRGSNEKGDRYKVNAREAVQQTQDVLLLRGIDAQLLSVNGGLRLLSAAQGRYEQSKKLLHLSGGVTVADDRGYVMESEAVDVNTATFDIAGDQPVTGNGPSGTLRASGIRVTNNGNRLEFLRGPDAPVHVTILRKGRT